VTYACEIELIELLNDIFKTIRRIARTQVRAYKATPADAEPNEEEMTV
jgi:hypothetical protein